MKILYVEDELAQNIERILQLFGNNVLSRKQCDKLRTLRDDPYGATNEDIRNIIASGVLVVETCFVEALKRIESDWERFDLYIVDRQLATDEHAYSEETISAIVPQFSSDDRDTYLTREGDYLFMRLLSKGNLGKAKMFYFLTAFTDAINCTKDLRHFMDIGWFKSGQVLEKGNSEHVSKLCEIIGQSRMLGLRLKFAPYFEALESMDHETGTLNLLARLLEAPEQTKKQDRGSVLAEARTLLESIVNRLCIRHNIPTDGGCTNQLSELGPYSEYSRRGSGVISRITMSLGKTAYTLCSEYGSHADQRGGVKPVPDDVFTCSIAAIRAFVLEVGR